MNALEELLTLVQEGDIDPDFPPLPECRKLLAKVKEVKANE